MQDIFPYHDPSAYPLLDTQSKFLWEHGKVNKPEILLFPFFAPFEARVPAADPCGNLNSCTRVYAASTTDCCSISPVPSIETLIA